jgi:hypothetical protein
MPSNNNTSFCSNVLERRGQKWRKVRELKKLEEKKRG